MASNPTKLELARLVVALFALTPGVVRADYASDLSAARAMWKTASIATYSFVYTDRGDTLIAPRCAWGVLRTRVKNGKPSLTVVVDGRGSCPPGTVLPESQRENAPRTIEDLFAIVERVLNLGPTIARVKVQYDAVYGFPTYLDAEKIGITDSDEGFPDNWFLTWKVTPRKSEVRKADGDERQHRVERRYMKFDRVFLFFFNFLARLFGVLAIFAGIVFLVNAYVIEDNRVLDIVVGLFAIVMGIAFLVTKSVRAEQLVRIRRRMGLPGPPEERSTVIKGGKGSRAVSH